MCIRDRERFGSKDLPIIAEDLGFLTPTVLKLVSDTGFPGMKVLEFAFDDTEDSAYLPHKYGRNCVVYTGTHDNDTCLLYTSFLGLAVGVKVREGHEPVLGQQFI